MVWITAEVDVDLEEFSDEDIRDEYHNRNLSSGIDLEDVETLTKIWLHDREGRKDEAYELMREYVLDKLNKVV
jgi:hypothetical protein